MISGGFTFFSDRISCLLGFDSSFANELIIEGNTLTGELKEPILGRKSKRSILLKLCRERDVHASDVIAVGDGANDLDMLSKAGTGVALHAKPSVAEQCDIRINFGDLTALLFIQGYSKENFVF